jgi:serine O-acetyltransferase
VKNLAEKLFTKHQNKLLTITTKHVESLVNNLLGILYPHFSEHTFQNATEVEERLRHIHAEIEVILQHLKIAEFKKIDAYLDKLALVGDLLDKDAQSIVSGDPAATSVDEVILCYPGFYAIATYRLAHELYLLGVPTLPRMMTEHAHTKTGIDIHPGAKIGEHFFIDHGTGIVIGETSQIGNHVKIYQGVTLGALSVKKSLQNSKRHPTIEDYCVIYANATILGGETIIGTQSVIGGSTWITSSVPPKSTILRKES